MNIPKIDRYTISDEGCISDSSGRNLYISTEVFIELIRNPTRCFVCGNSQADFDFNDEHVIPDWVQRFCQLRNKSIQLPNKTRYPYPRYKLPCCVKCNQFFGDYLESPISSAFHGEEEPFSEFLENGGLWKLFLWINFIYLKIHIKDNFLGNSRNARQKDENIGDFYPWEELHHCHAVTRALRFGVNVDVDTVLGSTMILHLGYWADEIPFDYNDHFGSRVVMIRIKRIAVICVPNDSCGTLQGVQPIIDALPSGLNAVQLAELLTEFQFVNLHLKYTPQYYTTISPKTGELLIAGKLPDTFELQDLDFSTRGFLMMRNLDGLAPNLVIEGFDRDETVRLIRTGDVSFLRGLSSVASPTKTSGE